MEMSVDALKGNMQANRAAFEAWALALSVWCDVKNVELDWNETPADQDCHFQRFLYRVAKFSRLFPWFRVSKPQALEHCLAIQSESPLINVRKSIGRCRPESGWNSA
jgi:hypothetical protein